MVRLKIEAGVSRRVIPEGVREEGRKDASSRTRGGKAKDNSVMGERLVVTKRMIEKFFYDSLEFNFAGKGASIIFQL